MDMALIQLILASIIYALGGLCMKSSIGLTRPLPTAMLFGLFILGATLQTLGMRHTDLGVAYIMVLGMEAVVALGLSVIFLHEDWSFSRLGAVATVVVGVYWLHRA
jgi:multidrug transporter EmrE-like cation transporter